MQRSENSRCKTVMRNHYPILPNEIIRKFSKESLREPYHDGLALRLAFRLAGELPKSERLPKATPATKQHAELIAKRLKEINESHGRGYSSIPNELKFRILHPSAYPDTKSNAKLAHLIYYVLLGAEMPVSTSEHLKAVAEYLRSDYLFMKRNVEIATAKRKQRRINAAKVASGRKNDTDAAFDKIWERHPIKKESQKRKAKSAFLKAIESTPLDEIDKGHITWCKSDNWKRENGRYVKNLRDWLEDCDWKEAPQERRTRREIENDELISCHVESSNLSEVI